MEDEDKIEITDEEADKFLEETILDDEIRTTDEYLSKKEYLIKEIKETIEVLKNHKFHSDTTRFILHNRVLKLKKDLAEIRQIPLSEDEKKLIEVHNRVFSILQKKLGIE